MKIVETNRQGVREYGAWVDGGTTLDREFLASGIGRPGKLPAETPAELAASVRLNQLELMEGDALQSIRAKDAAGRKSVFARRKSAPALPAFVAYAGRKAVGAAAPSAAAGGASNRQASGRASNEP